MIGGALGIAAAGLAQESNPGRNLSEGRDLSEAEVVSAAWQAEDEPPREFLLRDGLTREVLRQMASRKGRSATPGLRLLRWLGDPSCLPAVRKLAADPDLDRYEWLRTLVALDAPEAEALCLDYFLREPDFGAPLIRLYRNPTACKKALELLEGRESEYWTPAVWILGNSGQMNYQTPLEERRWQIFGGEDRANALLPRNLGGPVKLLQGSDARALDALQVAIRRLEIERRDIRHEALSEYLERVRDDRFDERLWCLVELGQCPESGALLILKQEPWLSRASDDSLEAAVLLWARSQQSESLSAAELQHYRGLRYHLGWLRGGTLWPPRVNRP